MSTKGSARSHCPGRPEPFEATVPELSGQESATGWEAAAAYPPYAEYQGRTDPEIPVLLASHRSRS